MKVGIITGPSLASTHGTGAQILRIFGTDEMPFFHLYWSASPFGLSECPEFFLLQKSEWPLPRGGRLVNSLQRRLGFCWWRGNHVHKRRLATLTTARRLRANVAYVVVASEQEAERALSLLSVLDCPFIVHLMDTVHEDGLDPLTMPAYRSLLTQASCVLALNAALQREALKFGLPDVRVVAFGQSMSPLSARAPEPRGELRVLLAGSLLMHQEGMAMLAQAWPEIMVRHPLARLIYTGPDFGSMSPALQRIAENRGYVPAAEYQKIVADSHLAFVAGPSTLDLLGRFSVPSRLSDFLMAGLPVLACVAPGSAAEAFLEPLVPESVCLTRSVAEIVGAFELFTESSERWAAAGRRGHEFARENLSIEAVRPRVFDVLREAVRRSPDRHVI